jgi:hypothetical protein
MNKKKKIFREGDNEVEFYIGKLKKVCKFNFVKHIRVLTDIANDLGFHCRINSQCHRHLSYCRSKRIWNLSNICAAVTT